MTTASPGAPSPRLLLLTRYLVQQPDAPEGLFGSIEAGDEALPFKVGQVHEMPIHGGTEPWRIVAIVSSPRPDYDSLIVFEHAR